MVATNDANGRNVAVIGLGYVGLPLLLTVSKKGYQATGIDTDQQKLQRIKAKKSPFTDKGVEQSLAEASLSITDDFSALAEADIVIMCVPTPVDAEHMPDLGPVRDATAKIGEHLQEGQLIIIESTVNPGVCDEVIIPLLEQKSGKRCGADFFLAHCPERINPGDAKWHVGNIARVVGGFDVESTKRAAEFYETIIDAPIKRMANLKEAEAVKIVENSFRDINIAFVNELAMSFTRLNIDLVHVIEGATTKPFSFMPHYPGVGVGGHCIPVDPYYLIEYAKQNGFTHRFLALARDINNGMPRFTVDRLKDALSEQGKELQGSKVALLGLSYKDNVGDLRESPALRVLSILKEEGADVCVYDPYVPDYNGEKKSHGGPVALPLAGSSANHQLLQAILNADAVLIAAAHSEFRVIDPPLLQSAGVVVVVDAKNCLNKELFEGSGISYRGIGR